MIGNALGDIKELNFSHIRADKAAPGMIVSLEDKSPTRILRCDDNKLHLEGDAIIDIRPEQALTLIGEKYVIDCGGLSPELINSLYLIKSLNESGGIVQHEIGNDGTVFCAQFMQALPILSNNIKEALSTINDSTLATDVPIVISVEHHDDELDFLDQIHFKHFTPQANQTALDVISYQNNGLTPSPEDDGDRCPTEKINKTVHALARHSSTRTSESCCFEAKKYDFGTRLWSASITLKNDDDKRFETLSAATMDLGRKLLRIGQALTEKGGFIDRGSPFK
ncbi:hypothetical protein BM525_20165 (plasmid) [Alteromonas mediterranea]|uniref:Uncharacterized protein n=1 Tax=Alteromonas mediterranea TaxID=314275 RepID=A0AAC9JEL3_9ALTE|nr:hypothetical protein [Alteromonas mediterranea]APD92199.1 hypothetical protein BM524_19970 [Alteromonas mediterranea]APE00054.1 hypothetical protein BM525_20165 [Alteromonas mediterranea]